MSWWRRRSVRERDLAFAALAAVVAGYDAARNTHPDAASAGLAVPLAVVMALTIAGRRTHAELALLTAAVTFQIAVLAGFPGGALLLVGAVVAHGAAGYGRRLTPLLTGVVLLASGVTAVGQWVLRGGDVPNSQARWVLAIVGTIVVAWGSSIRAQRRLAADLATRNAEAAVASERARLARELHDVAAHHLTALVLQARVAARLAATDPTQASALADAVADEGSTTLAALRRTVAVLGTDPGSNVQRNAVHSPEPGSNDPWNAVKTDGDLAPTPTLAQVGGLAERCRTAGLEVALIVDGPLDALPPDVDLAAYRMVQEALTNVLRHAQAQRADVSVERYPDRLDVAVSDDGAHAPDPTGVSRGGGLTGLAERVRACGGTWGVDRTGDLGGWRVAASFPLAERR